MPLTETYKGGENFDLRQVLLHGRALRLHQRTEILGSFLDDVICRRELLTMRVVTSAADREVRIVDPYTGNQRKMLMFGSNNYLGLANHPYVRQRVTEAIRKYGAGVGGPPLLNGYTILHRKLEERLAALKGTEDTLVFSSGYGANVGLVTGLMNPDDIVLYDTYSHASFCDGIRMAGVQSFRFPHNDIERLTAMLDARQENHGDIFVGVEGVYSMDGDLAPLDLLVPLCATYGALLVLDDAHGTGVMGPTGSGTAQHFGLEGMIDVTMGTFSKAFGATGGFVAASKAIVDYLRYFSRSYMFSASLPPPVIATVLAGLDVIEQEPELIQKLHRNVQQLTCSLQQSGFDVRPEAAIVPLRVPRDMDIRRMGYAFHNRGIFLNSVEYPAVPVSQQRFRISLMATHTSEDIDRLVETINEVWAEESASAAA
jgi:glycine C-acetyltransferase